MNEHENELGLVIKQISEKLDSDFFYYVGTIEYPLIDEFIKIVKSNKKHKNVSLIISTYGGNPDEAYRLSRVLQRLYNKFNLYVYRFCKSAGTLLALAADEVIISDIGELGPLDIQMLKIDEMTRISGLNYFQALIVMKDMAFQMWEDYFLEIKNRSGGTISTKTAANISKELTIGLLSPIMSQIDPIRLGEVSRALRIAEDYGERLSDNSDAVSTFATEYSTHSFVIDCEEVKNILDNARNPNSNEVKLGELLSDLLLILEEKTIQMGYISENGISHPNEDNNENNDQKTE